MSILSSTHTGYIKSIEDYIHNSLAGYASVHCDTNAGDNAYYIESGFKDFMNIYINGCSLPCPMLFKPNDTVSLCYFDDKSIKKIPQLFEHKNRMSMMFNPAFKIEIISECKIHDANVFKALLAYNPRLWSKNEIWLTSDEFCEMETNPAFVSALPKLHTGGNIIHAGDYTVDLKSLIR